MELDKNGSIEVTSLPFETFQSNLSRRTVRLSAFVWKFGLRDSFFIPFAENCPKAVETTVRKHSTQQIRLSETLMTNFIFRLYVYENKELRKNFAFGNSIVTIQSSLIAAWKRNEISEL